MPVWEVCHPPEATIASVIAEIEEKFRSLSDGEKAEVLRSLLAGLDGPAGAGGA